MQINIFGDSNSTTAFVSLANLYHTLCGSRFGYTINNHAVSSTMAMDQSYLIESVAPADINLIMLGTNDTYWYGLDATKMSVSVTYLRALAYVMGGGNYISGRNCTHTGTWANVTAAGNTLGVYSDTLNDTCTATVYGSSIYVSYIDFGAALSSPSFEVIVDGVSQGTYNATGDIAGNSLNGLTYSDACIRFHGFSSGSHIVVVKQKSSTVRLHVTFIGGSEMLGRKPLIIANVMKKHTYSGTDSDTNAANYSAAYATLVTELATDGFNVQLVDIKSAINPATDLEPDGIHITPTAEPNIVTPWENAILATLVPPTITGGGSFPTGTFTIPVSHLTFTCDGAGGGALPVTVS